MCFRLLNFWLREYNFICHRLLSQLIIRTIEYAPVGLSAQVDLWLQYPDRFLRLSSLVTYTFSIPTSFTASISLSLVQMENRIQ